MTIANSPNLLLAASRNDIELVKKILDDPSVSPKMIGITIAMAARRRYKECLQILINKWPEHISNNALSVAAYKGSVECLQMLLEKNGPILQKTIFAALLWRALLDRISLSCCGSMWIAPPRLPPN